MNKNPSNADEIFRWPSRCSCERCNYARKAWESVDTGEINTNDAKYKKEMTKRRKNTDKSAEQFPNVLFFRDNKYSSIDEFIITNKKKFKCSIKIIDKLEAINKLYSTNYHLLITYRNHSKGSKFLLDTPLKDFELFEK